MDSLKKYINDILNNKILSCDYVKQAINRHVKDIKNQSSKEFLFYFDEEEAKNTIEFIELLQHVEGEWAKRNENLLLQPWQKFIIASLFGWKNKKTGLRRFRKAYVEVPRKNGKSVLGSAIGIKMFQADGEIGAQCYTAATTMKQAAIVHTVSKKMVVKNKLLREKIAVYKKGNNIFYLVDESDGGIYEPLPADSDKLDGLNVNFANVDEYHAHKSDELYNQLESGMAARAQPLLFIITTAGVTINGPCYIERDYVINLLKNEIKDNSYFGIIYTLDKDDDWQDENMWAKANPNLGISKSITWMRNACTKAVENPINQSEFKTKHLNLWQNTAQIWITHDKWLSCNNTFDMNSLEGQLCYGAFDLSTNIDITAWTLCFQPENEGGEYKFIHKFFIPKDNIVEAGRRDKVPYGLWAEQGYIYATPGDVIDYHFIEEQILHDVQKYKIKEIAYDKYNASDLVTRLQEKINIPLLQFSQSWSMLSPASKQFENKAYSGKMAHNKNPVMTWMISCTAIKQDVDGNIRPVKPDRQQSGKRIDGVITSMMALDRAIKNIEKKSVYEERGVLLF